MNHKRFLVAPGRTMRLKDHEPGFTGKYEQEEQAAAALEKNIKRLAKYQDMLYAQNTHALLLILQGMDTAGKDGIIRHVMAGLNPQGAQVYSFKAPSAEELDHDYLWRSMRDLPERGRIGIFNRSYYEEVLVVRVHPEMLKSQHLPHADGEHVWKHRFDEINRFEQYLVRNGIAVLKVFLNLSKEEQKRRLLARIDTPEKNWKCSLDDVKERFEDLFPPQKITVEELGQFVGMLHRSGLVITDAPGQGQQLVKRYGERKRQERLAAATNILT